MSERNVKIQSLSKANGRINLTEFNGKSYPIKAKSSVKITEDELSYLMNSSNALKDGTLKVMNEEILSADIDKDELVTDNAFSDRDIEELLKKQFKAIESGLNKIDNIDVVKRILEKANELDKSVKVVGLIENRIEKLMA